MIKIQNLNKSFGVHKVLSNLNLHIPKGKITVIIGRSGEGKSVFLKHLMGLVKPDSGKIEVGGQSMLDLDDLSLTKMRKNFGLLFQHAALFDSMDVFHNISFPLYEHSGDTDNAIKERVSELISLVGLRPDVLKKFPSELSGGMKKRVGLARAIALKPKILLYDEPTTGLDPIMTDVIDQLILTTQRSLGITSVVISHDIKATFAIADKVAMLHEGKILLEGSPSEFQKTTNPVAQGFIHGKATGQQLKEL